MKNLVSLGLVLGTLSGFGFSGVLLGQGDQTRNQDKGPAVSKAERQEMAVAHEKMAACLRSERPLSACQDEMRATGKRMMQGGCPMMDEGMRSHHGDMGHDYHE